MKAARRSRRRPPVIMAPVQGQRRGVLNRIRARARKFGFKEADVRPYRLRLYSKLVNNKSSSIFAVAQETKTYPMEIRLEKSDAIWIDRLGLAIHKVLIVGGEEIANTPLIHYPDLNWFPGTNVARDCEGLYNSFLSVKTDNDIRLESFDTGMLRHVPEQQYEPSATDPKLFQTTGNEMYDLETNFGIWGNKRTELEVKYGAGTFGAIAGLPADPTTPYQNYAVVLLEGFLLVRGAEAVTVSDASLIFRGL